jgi:hypothetical protein
MLFNSRMRVYPVHGAVSFGLAEYCDCCLITAGDLDVNLHSGKISTVAPIIALTYIHRILSPPRSPPLPKDYCLIRETRQGRPRQNDPSGI